MAGLLACVINLTFPLLITVVLRQKYTLNKAKHTVAGTAPDFHWIPF